jgi:hypothetical protein
MQNVEATITSQFANSPRIVQLIKNMNAYFSPDANFDNFYNQIWNIDTAVGYGLDVWGRIVGVTRVLQVSNGVNLGATGPDGNSGDSMNVAPFYQSAPLTANFSLSDDAFRMLIFAKALANITDGSIPSINAILMNLFGSNGQAFVTDLGNMQMQYVFQFPLSPVDAAIVSQSGVLPRPPGVSATIVQG